MEIIDVYHTFQTIAILFFIIFLALFLINKGTHKVLPVIKKKMLKNHPF